MVQSLKAFNWADALYNESSIKPTVSILIVAWNSGDDLERCMAALDAQSTRDFEVILLDNGSTDGAVARLAARSWLRVERSEINLGFAAGNNRAARAACGRYLVTLNPDAFPEPDWLEMLVSAAERYPEAGSVGSTQLLDADPNIYDGAGDPYTLFGAAWRGDKGRPARPIVEGEVFGVCAAAALYRREVFEAVGGFEERFFCYYEDVDLALRLRLAGWTAVQTPSARVRHVGSGSAPSGFVLRHATRNRIWTLIRGLPDALIWLGAPLAMGLAIAAALAGVLRGETWARLSAIGEAFRGLGETLRERRAIQMSATVTQATFLRALTWSPWRYLRRRSDVRPVSDLTERVAEPPDHGRTVAVIVSYQPDQTLSAVIGAALGQCDRVVLVDNGSEAETVDHLRVLSGKEDRLILIENGKNLGLAKAQNIGLAKARGQGADWILLLDDDSVPEPGMVAALIAAWTDLPDRRRVGLLTPRLTDDEDSLKPYLLTARGRFNLDRTPMVPGGLVRDGVFAIASGSLIRSKVLDVVGDMAADYFIDYVDIEFSLRMRAAGFEIVGVGDAVLRHRLGEFQRIAGSARGLNTHSAWRRFYIHRNRVRVWRDHGGTVLGWLVWDMVAAGYDVLKVLRHEDDKHAKLKAIARGWLAGLTG
jgi:GT2 family glycosyltransferase